MIRDIERKLNDINIAAIEEAVYEVTSNVGHLSPNDWTLQINWSLADFPPFKAVDTDDSVAVELFEKVTDQLIDYILDLDWVYSVYTDMDDYTEGIMVELNAEVFEAATRAIETFEEAQDIVQFYDDGEEDWEELEYADSALDELLVDDRHEDILDMVDTLHLIYERVNQERDGLLDVFTGM